MDNLEDYHVKNFYSLAEGIRQSAVDFLAESSDWEGFSERYGDDPEEWWAEDMWHFRGGMAVRNRLRMNGFGEKELGVENLDDFYIPLIEKAAEKLGIITLNW